MFELYQLRYFLSVVETGSFTKAAERAFVTQPTLSAGIQKLEASLGVRLFNRSNRRVYLTEAGARFVERAKAILHQCNLAEREVHETKAPKVLRLGVLMTIPCALLERLLGGFRRAEPDVVIELFEGTEQELLNRLESGGMDVALSLLRGPVAVGRDRPTPPVVLFEEGYVLAVNAAHPLASRTEVAGRELADEPTIVRTRCEILSETSRYFTDQNVRPRLVYRTPQDERALAMVAAGLGFTTLPQSYEHPGVVKVTLTGYNYRRRVGLILSDLIDEEEKKPLLDRFAAFARREPWRDAPLN